MWRVSWHFILSKPAQRGGQTTKTEHKHFTEQVPAIRYGKRVARFSEWVTVKPVPDGEGARALNGQVTVKEVPPCEAAS